MENLTLIAQVVVALVLLNVWLVRSRRPTEYRPGDAKNMTEEFARYGLPEWSMWTVGFAKVGLALLLIAGIWAAPLTRPAAIGVALLMLGAVVMHTRVGDPIKKSVPALTLLVLSLLVAIP